jgi:hypothetical protein
MPAPDDMICKACSHITRLIRIYAIKPHEWPLMQCESPELWNRIEKLEWLGPMELGETQKTCRILIMNYERMFMRRVSRRERRHAA